MSESKLSSSTELQVLQDFQQQLGQTIGELQEKEKAREAKEACKRRVKYLLLCLIFWPCADCCIKGGRKKCLCSLFVSLMFYGAVLTALMASKVIRLSTTAFICIPVSAILIGVFGVVLCLKKNDCCQETDLWQTSSSSRVREYSYTPLSNQNSQL